MTFLKDRADQITGKWDHSTCGLVGLFKMVISTDDLKYLGKYS